MECGPADEVIDGLVLEMLGVECLIVASRRVGGVLRVARRGKGVEMRVGRGREGVWMLVV